MYNLFFAKNYMTANSQYLILKEKNIRKIILNCIVNLFKNIRIFIFNFKT